MNKNRLSAAHWAGVLLAGALAGFAGGQFLSPWLAACPLADKINWPGKNKETTMIVNKTEKVYLTEDLAYQDAISRVLGSVVYARAVKADKKLAEGVGFILTGDGLIVASGSVVVKGAVNFVIIHENEEYAAELIREDKENNLALFKAAVSGWPVVNFGETANLKIGERIFLPGINAAVDSVYSEFVLAGFVKTVAPEISFSMVDKPLLAGEPVMNSRGEIIGLALLDKNGGVELAGAEKIKALMK